MFRYYVNDFDVIIICNGQNVFRILHSKMTEEILLTNGLGSKNFFMDAVFLCRYLPNYVLISIKLY